MAVGGAVTPTCVVPVQSCDDGNLATTDSFDPETGRCDYVPVRPEG